jgi:hypothetical protein
MPNSFNFRGKNRIQPQPQTQTNTQKKSQPQTQTNTQKKSQPQTQTNTQKKLYYTTMTKELRQFLKTKIENKQWMFPTLHWKEEWSKNPPTRQDEYYDKMYLYFLEQKQKLPNTQENKRKISHLDFVLDTIKQIQKQEKKEKNFIGTKPVVVEENKQKSLQQQKNRIIRIMRKQLQQQLNKQSKLPYVFRFENYFSVDDILNLFSLSDEDQTAYNAYKDKKIKKLVLVVYILIINNYITIQSLLKMIYIFLRTSAYNVKADFLETIHNEINMMFYNRLKYLLQTFVKYIQNNGFLSKTEQIYQDTLGSTYKIEIDGVTFAFKSIKTKQQTKQQQTKQQQIKQQQTKQQQTKQQQTKQEQTKQEQTFLRSNSSSSYLVKIYATFQNRNTLFFLMELLDPKIGWKNIGTMIKNNEGKHINNLTICKKIIEGISGLNEQEIYLKDINPSSIMYYKSEIKEEIKFIHIPSSNKKEKIYDRNNNYICYDILNEKDRQLFAGFTICIDVIEHKKFSYIMENIKKTGKNTSNIYRDILEGTYKSDTTYSESDRVLLESFDKLMESYIPNKFYTKLKQDMIQL